MKIREVELFQVKVPLIPPIARVNPHIYDITICRIRTDEGIDGIGESAVYSLRPAEKAALEAEAAGFVGKDPLTLDPFAQTGLFECALLDIKGRAYGIPVSQFFGPRVRDRVPVSYWSCPMEPADTAAEAEAGKKLGFFNHKLKARSWNIVETVRLMKEQPGATTRWASIRTRSSATCTWRPSLRRSWSHSGRCRTSRTRC